MESPRAINISSRRVKANYELRSTNYEIIFRIIITAIPSTREKQQDPASDVSHLLSHVAYPASRIPDHLSAKDHPDNLFQVFRIHFIKRVKGGAVNIKYSQDHSFPGPDRDYNLRI